jgi:hypothetical protein
MNTLTKTIQNNTLAALAAKAPAGVANAIKQASARTGVNFAYLVQQAKVESSFDPAAKAKTSSATGLYQFIESTWLSMMDKFGAKHGLNVEGKSRAEILAMRKDANTASLMAAEFASENEKYLKSHWGGDIGSTELYLAHFMGAGQAAGFLRARDENPLQPAAVLFPQAAKANRNVFYDQKTGQARSLEDVYGFFDRKFQIEDKTPVVAQNESARPAANTGGSLYKGSVYLAATTGRRNFHNPLPVYQLTTTPVEVMLMAQLEPPSGFRGFEERDRNDTFSLFSRARSYNQ